MNEPESKLAEQPGGRILVVDDEEKNRRLLADMLCAAGYTVQTANNGLEALPLATGFSPEAILMDVMMPKLDGLETCSRLKADPETASIPILLVTALHDRADRFKGIQAGANDFLPKPLDGEEVRLRVKNAVYSKRLYDRVTAAYEHEQKLQTLQKNLIQFVVHDLRTPLTAMIAHLELLKLGYLEPLNGKQQESVENSFGNAHLLLEMINSLLDVARMESGQLPVRRERCDLRQLALEALAALGPLIGNTRLTWDVSPEAPLAVCDGALIRRVFVNLLGNAARFVSMGGDIEIAVAWNAGAWKISVTDSGPGIPPQYHEKIFEKFGQVDAHAGRNNFSTGLGLAFCKLAVEAHGGGIGLESPSTLLTAGAADGKGSTFWFTLPEIEKGLQV